MTYRRFSELWDAFITNRPRSAAAAISETIMQPATRQALIEYGLGNKSKIEAVRTLLDNR